MIATKVDQDYMRFVQLEDGRWVAMAVNVDKESALRRINDVT